MARIPLRMGPLAPPGFIVQRSGLRWLCQDGQTCKPGQAIAYCNIAITPAGRPTYTHIGFIDELRDFQAAFVLKTAGRIHIAANSSQGGFMDQHYWHQVWDPDFVIGELECEEASKAGAEPLRVMLAAGRRVSEIAEVRAGLLTGWHARSRAWWSDGAGATGTLLSLGTCEVTAAIRGEQFAFLELLNALPGPAQIVLVPDDILVPCARVTLEQILRTPEQSAQIAADFASTFPFGSATASDWIFAGALLSALQRSPLTEDNYVVSRAGIQKISQPDAVVMSLLAEPQRLLRHRRLGYALYVHSFRTDEMSDAARNWFREHFEPVPRGPDDIHRDYRELLDIMQRRSKTQFLVTNLMSSSGDEDILNYAQFDAPMGRTLSTIRNKEMNLMLHDLAAERDIAIVDVDAITADLGAARHLPDGIHQSGTMQAEIRREILHILDSRRVPGFGARIPR